MKRLLFLLAALSAWYLPGRAQNVPTGQWDIHLPYGNGNSVCEGDGYIYVGTATGMYSVKQDGLDIKRYSTVNGLSDVGVSALGYSAEARCLIIGYANGNIDLMKGSSIINIKDIIGASSITFKKISSITIRGKLAYLACDFGIAVIDLEKEETPAYVIFSTAAGLEMPVHQVAIADDGTIAAASDAGLYRYSGTGAFQDFGAWTRYPNVFVGTYNAVVNHAGTLYANYSRKLSNGIDNQDTVYRFDGNTWQVWDTVIGRTVRSLDVQNGKFTLVMAPVSGFTGTVLVKNPDGTDLVRLDDDFMFEAVRGFTDSQGITWVAHANLGVVRVFNHHDRNIYYPPGPFSGGSYRMTHDGKSLWVAAGGMSPGFSPLYHVDGVLRLNEEDKWDYFNLVNSPLMAGSSDYLDIVTDPSKEGVTYAIAYRGGIFRISGNTVTDRYDSSTTGGALVKAPLFDAVLGSSLSMDDNGALWVGMAFSSKPLAVRKPNGTWQSFTIPGVGQGDAVNVVKAMSNGQIWVSVRGKGIYVIKHDNYTSISQARNINSNSGSGSLPSLYVQAIVQERDGEVWVGTENGFIIFYSPDVILTSSAFNGVIPVVVAADGNNEKLLDGVFVRDIYVDGGNRKWMATYGAGAYLISADGYTIQKHFMKNNSPLLSDNLLSVTVHPLEGNVYFGTDIGIISYRGDATSATDNFSDHVYAFPNPVRAEFTGPVTISGLAQDAQLKITDISGQLVYQTKANGGTAVWSGNGFDGRRAKTGVYLVFASNTDGTQKEVTRILVVN